MGDAAAAEILQLARELHGGATLKPPEAFPDEPPPRELVAALYPPGSRRGRGRRSTILDVVVCSKFAGWPGPPSGEELYDAIHAADPTERQRCMVRAWATEATPGELVQAFGEGAYTIRELATALHRCDFRWTRRIRKINRWAGSD